MPLSLVNTVAQAGHEQRDFHLSQDAEEKGRRMVLRLSELPNVYSTHHDDSSCATTPQDAAVEAANTGSQRQASSEGLSSPPGGRNGQDQKANLESADR